MALVSTGYFANVTLVDQEGNKSTLRYALTSADIETAVTNAASIVAALNPITDAVIVAYSVGEGYEEDTSFFAPTGVHVENVALVMSRIDASEEKWAQLRIPAPSIGIFQASTGKKAKIVDPADADLVTYLNLFVQSGGVCTLSDGEYLLNPGTPAYVEGKRIHRANRNG